MKRNLLVAALVALAGLLASSAHALAARPFSFVALGDSRGDACSEPVDAPVLGALIQHILDLKPRPRFVLFAGDLVRGRYIIDLGRSPSLPEQLHAWLRTVAPLEAAGIRILAVPGNHEIGGLFASDCQRQCRQVLGPLQYSFHWQDTWVIGLNTDRAHHGASADLPFLKAQLARAKASGASHIFVLGHEPAFPVDAGRGLDNADAFWALLAHYRVDAYICGHEHLYGRLSRDGVAQVTTGGAGAPLEGARGPKEGDYNLTLWQVDGPKVEVRALGMSAGSGSWRPIDSFSLLRPQQQPAVTKAAAQH